MRGSQRAIGRAFRQVAGELESYIRGEWVSTPFPPPSEPYTPPHLRTGSFRAGVRVSGSEKGLTISSTEPYGAYLEHGVKRAARQVGAKRAKRIRIRMGKTGTSGMGESMRKVAHALMKGPWYMKPRPWARAALTRNRQTIEARIAKLAREYTGGRGKARS